MIQTYPENTHRSNPPIQLSPSRITTSQPPPTNRPPSNSLLMPNMPQHQPPPQSQGPPPGKHRHVHKKSFLNPSFIGAIVAILALSIAFIYQYLIVSKPVFWIPALIIFLILLAMTQWSYFSTVCTHPGRVPFYYGLSSQITQQKQLPRKYCVMCHNFKPQRTHHCSTCRTCVLNMDHHCPWVNNCVGYWNRKYFILFLIYITLGLIFMSIVQIIVLVFAIKNAVQTKSTDVHFALKLIIALITFPLTFMLFAFTLFHVKMVLNNTTTLQGMIRKKTMQQSMKPSGERQPVEQVDDYDIGWSQNFKQVFGQSAAYWGIPVYGNGPKGNGTYFPKGRNGYDGYYSGTENYRTREEYQSRPLTHASGMGGIEYEKISDRNVNQNQRFLY